MIELAHLPLNSAQQRSIESVHRGYLYQHLYAAACLLTAGQSGMKTIIVEGDEDIELRRITGYSYIQIKTRSRPLNATDLEGALRRFDVLRQEYLEGRRSGIPTFYFISNQAPGPDLHEEICSVDWPSDIIVIWPGRIGMESHSFLPPSWSDISEAARWCIERAERVRFRKTSAETLVWKLAAISMLAASGGVPYENHSFIYESLPQLFEQLVVGLQDFPPAPTDYRPQINEPSIRSKNHVRMIVGFSGAGKTAWASYGATHSENLCIYYDVGEQAGPAVVAALANEIAATFSELKSNTPIEELLLPSASGIESLRRASQHAAKHALEPIIVIDNAHRLSASVTRSIIEIAPAMKFLLLCQPSGSSEETEAVLGITHEQLQGWDDDAVAATIADLGVRGTPDAIKRLRMITSGMPLYVASAARITKSEYSSDVKLFCAAIDSQTHAASTAQEVILAKLYDTLPHAAGEAVAIMSYCDVGLTQQEMEILLGQALHLDAQQTAHIIRTLRPLGILLPVDGTHYRVHDSFRILGNRQFALICPDNKNNALKKLANILLLSLTGGRNIKRISMLVRVYADLGDFSVLVGLAGEEMFHELGIGEDVWKILEHAVTSETMAAKQRFDALDGLVFRYLKIGQPSRVAPLLDQMERLVETGDLQIEDKMSFLAKKLLWQADAGDKSGVLKGIASIEKIVPDDAAYQRIFRYLSAQALWKLGQIPKAEVILRKLAVEYMKVLGISDSQIFGQPTNSIRNIIEAVTDYHSNAKRLADVLEFHAKTLGKMDRNPIQIRIQSMKFYEIVGAYDSLIRVGMDVVEDFMSVGDHRGAKIFSEQFVMPAVVKIDSPKQSIFVRSQYAEILSRCGEFEEAEEVLRLLRPYYNGLEEEELQNVLVSERIVQQAGMKAHTAPAQTARRRPRPNEPCLCGSGLKFKKCHGQCYR